MRLGQLATCGEELSAASSSERRAHQRPPMRFAGNWPLSSMWKARLRFAPMAAPIASAPHKTSMTSLSFMLTILIFDISQN